MTEDVPEPPTAGGIRPCLLGFSWSGVQSGRHLIPHVRPPAAWTSAAAPSPRPPTGRDTACTARAPAHTAACRTVGTSPPRRTADAALGAARRCARRRPHRCTPLTPYRTRQRTAPASAASACRSGGSAHRSCVSGSRRTPRRTGSPGTTPAPPGEAAVEPAAPAGPDNSMPSAPGRTIHSGRQAPRAPTATARPARHAPHGPVIRSG